MNPVSERSQTGTPAGVVLMPDAGPLITLAYADALDLLFKPGWTVQLVDMVLNEVTRSPTPTNQRLAVWARRHRVPVLTTRTFEHHSKAALSAVPARRKSNLGDLAIQEVMGGFD